MRKHVLKKSLIVGIIILFTCSSFASSISEYSDVIIKEKNSVEEFCEPQEKVVVSCNTYGTPIKSSREIKMSYSEAEELFEKINKLAGEIAYTPSSDEIEKLQEDIIINAKEYDLLPEDISFSDFQPRFLTPKDIMKSKKGTLPVVGNRGTASFCNFATTGEGSQFPIIILPRLIPILLTPIPRAFLHWSANEGFTTCGSLLTKTGFIASGMQRGTALGFWGIGFSVFLPPVMAYGFIGYALFATCTAEEIEPWPPNYAPEVSAVSPSDGAENVAISTSELTFQISDDNEDKMDYAVTTNPDIGSGSGNNKPDGTYSIPISGLEGTEEYTWYVEVTDGQKTVEASFSFETEQVAPIVTDPSPLDKAINVQILLPQLSFKLKDPQGDLMDYTVETSPDIGSGSGTNVGEGAYILKINNVEYSTDYTWYVNVTDGTNWKHKVYDFKTRPVPGPWWNDEWSYRKEIIVNYEMVEGSHNNFPIVIKLESDDDLSVKVQSDGDDIVFTDYSGTKLNHEIEFYNSQDGTLFAWVNIPSLSADTILYMYYGNMTSTCQQNIEGTWDSHFMMVHHLHGDNASNCLDSTENDNDVTDVGGTPDYQQTGQIGYGIEFIISSEEYLSIPASPSLDISECLTMSLWFNPTHDTGPPEHMGLCGRWDTGVNKRAYSFYTSPTYMNLFYGSISENGAWIEGKRSRSGTAENELEPNIWQHIVMTFDPSTQKVELYRNGVNVVDKYRYTNANEIDLSDVSFLIGAHQDNGNPYRFTDGLFDEVRVSNMIRSNPWILMEYQNQYDPLSFYYIGPEETGS